MLLRLHRMLLGGFIFALIAQWLLAVLPTVQTLYVAASQPASRAVESAEATLRQRHREAAHLLPASGRISYLTDRDHATNPGSLARFYKAQYHLAPLRLDRAATHPWALADFHEADRYHTLLFNGEWLVVGELGDGLAVLRRSGEVTP